MFAHAPHLRTHMGGGEIDGDAVWLQLAYQEVGDLLTDTLLQGESAREEPDDPGQLRDPDDVLVRWL